MMGSIPTAANKYNQKVFDVICLDPHFTLSNAKRFYMSNGDRLDALRANGELLVYSFLTNLLLSYFTLFNSDFTTTQYPYIHLA